MLDAVSSPHQAALAGKGHEDHAPSQPDLCAGQSLLDLPAPLLSEIVRNLDVCSQRNLFLVSSQLYNKWQLQVQPQDADWHFLKRSLDILAHSAVAYGKENLGATGIKVYSQDASWAEIRCSRGQSTFELDIHGVSSNDDQGEGLGFCPALTLNELWHKLASMPGLSSATLLCESRLVKNPASSQWQQQLKVLAQGLFTLLLAYDGYFVLHLMVSSLMIRHQNSSHSAPWTMDYENCISNPPELHWEHFPKKVKGVRAVFFSRSTHQDLREEQDRSEPWCEFDPDETRVNFAYKGNVDVDAWIEEQREISNDWLAVHEGMNDEDFEEMYGYEEPM